MSTETLPPLFQQAIYDVETKSGFRDLRTTEERGIDRSHDAFTTITGVAASMTAMMRAMIIVRYSWVRRFMPPREFPTGGGNEIKTVTLEVYQGPMGEIAPSGVPTMQAYVETERTSEMLLMGRILPVDMHTLRIPEGRMNFLQQLAGLIADAEDTTDLHALRTVVDASFEGNYFLTKNGPEVNTLQRHLRWNRIVGAMNTNAADARAFFTEARQYLQTSARNQNVQLHLVVTPKVIGYFSEGGGKRKADDPINFQYQIMTDRMMDPPIDGSSPNGALPTGVLVYEAPAREHIFTSRTRDFAAVASNFMSALRTFAEFSYAPPYSVPASEWKSVHGMVGIYGARKDSVRFFQMDELLEVSGFGESPMPTTEGRGNSVNSGLNSQMFENAQNVPANVTADVIYDANYDGEDAAFRLAATFGELMPYSFPNSDLIRSAESLGAAVERASGIRITDLVSMINELLSKVESQAITDQSIRNLTANIYDANDQIAKSDVRDQNPTAAAKYGWRSFTQANWQGPGGYNLDNATDGVYPVFAHSFGGFVAWATSTAALLEKDKARKVVASCEQIERVLNAHGDNILLPEALPTEPKAPVGSAVFNLIARAGVPLFMAEGDGADGVSQTTANAGQSLAVANFNGTVVDVAPASPAPALNDNTQDGRWARRGVVNSDINNNGAVAFNAPVSVLYLALAQSTWGRFVAKLSDAVYGEFSGLVDDLQTRLSKVTSPNVNLISAAIHHFASGVDQEDALRLINAIESGGAAARTADIKKIVQDYNKWSQPAEPRYALSQRVRAQFPSPAMSADFENWVQRSSGAPNFGGFRNVSSAETTAWADQWVRSAGNGIDFGTQGAGQVYNVTNNNTIVGAQAVFVRTPVFASPAQARFIAPAGGVLAGIAPGDPRTGYTSILGMNDDAGIAAIGTSNTGGRIRVADNMARMPSEFKIFDNAEAELKAANSMSAASSSHDESRMYAGLSMGQIAAANVSNVRSDGSAHGTGHEFANSLLGMHRIMNTQQFRDRVAMLDGLNSASARFAGLVFLGMHFSKSTISSLVRGHVWQPIFPVVFRPYATFRADSPVLVADGVGNTYYGAQAMLPSIDGNTGMIKLRADYQRGAHVARPELIAMGLDLVFGGVGDLGNDFTFATEASHFNSDNGHRADLAAVWMPASAIGAMAKTIALAGESPDVNHPEIEYPNSALANARYGFKSRMENAEIMWPHNREVKRYAEYGDRSTIYASRASCYHIGNDLAPKVLVGESAYRHVAYNGGAAVINGNAFNDGLRTINEMVASLPIETMRVVTAGNSNSMHYNDDGMY